MKNPEIAILAVLVAVLVAGWAVIQVDIYGGTSVKVTVGDDGTDVRIDGLLPSDYHYSIYSGADVSSELYYWYDGSRAYQTAPADQRSSDLAQRIPTYETVLELDTDTITQAGYEVKGELPCVFVETEDRELELVRRYWISVDSGLLAAAETWQLGQLTYQVTALSSITSPCPSSASFQLPDGTLLHSVS